jgi:hypothetical protein
MFPDTLRHGGDDGTRRAAYLDQRRSDRRNANDAALFIGAFRAPLKWVSALRHNRLANRRYSGVVPQILDVARDRTTGTQISGQFPSSDIPLARVNPIVASLL